jgi:hypothetical protein
LRSEVGPNIVRQVAGGVEVGGFLRQRNRAWAIVAPAFTRQPGAG